MHKDKCVVDLTDKPVSYSETSRRHVKSIHCTRIRGHLNAESCLSMWKGSSCCS